MKKVWVPDGMACRIEWYLSDSKAVGVQSITDDWVPRDVGEPRRAGFKNAWDPERDLPTYTGFREDDDE
jgi:hypothetical protein